MAKPIGVKVHRRNGEVLDAELIHLGIAQNGLDEWVIASPQVDLTKGDHVSVEELPGLTTVTIPTPPF